jgi:hypothetical protein
LTAINELQTQICSSLLYISDVLQLAHVAQIVLELKMMFMTIYEEKVQIQAAGK